MIGFTSGEWCESPPSLRFETVYGFAKSDGKKKRINISVHILIVHSCAELISVGQKETHQQQCSRKGILGIECVLGKSVCDRYNQQGPSCCQGYRAGIHKRNQTTILTLLSWINTLPLWSIIQRGRLDRLCNKLSNSFVMPHTPSPDRHCFRGFDHKGMQKEEI